MIAIGSVMRMNSDGREDARMPFGNFDRQPIDFDRFDRTDGNDRFNSGGGRARKRPIEIRKEPQVGQMTMRVENWFHSG